MAEEKIEYLDEFVEYMIEKNNKNPEYVKRAQGIKTIYESKGMSKTFFFTNLGTNVIEYNHFKEEKEHKK